MRPLLDGDGNLWMEPICVIAVGATSDVFWIGEGHANVLVAGGQEIRPAEGTGGQFAGGSGRNWQLASAAPGLQGGFYKAVAPDLWQSVRNPAWSWTREGDGTYSLRDAVDVVATAAAGSPATAASTAYGESEYGGVPFTVDLEYEGGAEWPGKRVGFRMGESTAQAGFYARTGWQSCESEDTPGWVATIDGAGDGELTDGTDVVARRTGGPLYDFSGDWVPTAYGKATYGPLVATISGTRSAGSYLEQEYRPAGTVGGNSIYVGVTDPSLYIEFDAPMAEAWLRNSLGVEIAFCSTGSTGSFDGVYNASLAGRALYNLGAAWTYTVATATAGGDFSAEAGEQRAVPAAGKWWGELTLDAGTKAVTGAAGPFFGAALPGNSSVLAVIPIAESDGAGTVRGQAMGAVVWPLAVP